MGRGYIAIEGHGEVKAIHNLVVRLWQDSRFGPALLGRTSPPTPGDQHPSRSFTGLQLGPGTA